MFYLLLNCFLYKDWDDYWNDGEIVEPTQYYYVSQEKHLYLAMQKLYIFYSFFQNVHGGILDRGGGAICCEGTKLLIETSSFITCISGNSDISGGAIYETGSYIFSKVCGIDCYSALNGVFSYCSASEGKIYQSSLYL